MHVQNQLVYPYAPKDPPIYSGIFNHFYDYYKKHEVQPNFFESKIKIKNSIIEKLKSINAKELFVHKTEYKNKNFIII